MPYTLAEKEHALDIYRREGANVAAREIGCSRQTIYQWLEESESDDTDIQKKKETRAASAERVSNAWSDFRAQEALAAGAAANRMRREALEASTERNANLLKARVVAYGIFIDKAELLSGQATQRIQVWAESEIDRDLREAMSELEDRIRGGES